MLSEQPAHAHGTLLERRRSLSIVFGLTLLYLVVEVIAGILTNSLSLLADAVHMLTDAGGIALALFATWIAQKPANLTKTFGYYRWEILAALINAVFLLGSGAWILMEAVRRFQEPATVLGVPMLIVASIGLVVNLVAIRVLHPGASKNLNVEGAFMEVVKDALGSVGVIIASLIVWLTGWNLADPLASVLISLLILPRTWHLLQQAVHILLEGVPTQVSLPEVETALRGVEGVSAVHDIHIWAISSEVLSLSAHVVLSESATPRQAQQVLEDATALLITQFDIEHTTIQVEYQDLSGAEPAL